MIKRNTMLLSILFAVSMWDSVADEPDLTRSVHLTPFPQSGPLEIPEARTDLWGFELEPQQSARYNVTIADSGTSPPPEEYVYNLVPSSIAVGVSPDYNYNILWAWQVSGGGQSYVCDVVNTVWVNNTASVSINCRWERTLTGGSGSGASGLGFEPIYGWALGLATHKQSDFEVSSSMEIDGAPEYLCVNEIINLHAWLVIGDFPFDDAQLVDAVWNVESIDGGVGVILEEYPTSVATFVAMEPGRVRVTATVPDSSPTLTDSVEFTIFRVQVKEIHFNHNASSMTDDGVTIKKNHTTLITAPEWRRSPAKNDPACYIRNTTANVKVKLGVVPDSITSAIIAASPVTGGAAGLPSLGQKTVSFTAGVSGLTDFPMTAPATVKILEDSWKWEVSVVNGTAVDPCVVDTTVDHKIFVILTTPKGVMQEPWVQVLEYACNDAYAGGTSANLDAMNGIVNGLHYQYPKLRYSPVYGDDEPPYYEEWYGGNHKYKLTKFFAHTENPSVAVINIACQDMCDLSLIFGKAVGAGDYHFRRKKDFKTNLIKTIGEITHTQIGWWNWDFAIHHFVQRDGSGAQGNVWEPTFRLDENGGESKPCNEILPKNMSFALYESLLVKPPPDDWSDPWINRTGKVTVIE